MKLTIGQMVLESVAYAHPGNYLSIPPTDGNVAGEMEIGIDLLKAAEHGANIVRLRARATGATPYQFALAYVVILLVDLEGAEAPPDLDKRITVTGCNMLYPFAREVMASLTSKGRFGTTWLNPVDFNAVVQKMTFEDIPAAELGASG